MSQAALDRQIRPIYDALDTGSNKSAVQACNKLLKKHPTHALVKALKALAVVRMNKVEDALPLCDDVLATKPTDLDTLTAMMHVLRALGRNADTVAMFDDAYRKQPANEELGAQSFFANVRTGNWKSAQQIATKMHRQFKGDRYLYWSVTSALLQAGEPSTPPVTRNILLQLAARLLAGAVDPPHASADRLHVHLALTAALRRPADAHALLAPPPAAAIVAASLSVEELRRALARAGGAWAEEAERATRRLKEGDRNWLEFESVLDEAFIDIATPPDAEGDIVVRTGAAADAVPRADVDDEARARCTERVRAARGLFVEFADADGRGDRSALLAQLELARRATRHNVSGADEQLGLMEVYLARFGDKACCFEDLRPYCALSGADLERWAALLDAHVHCSDTLDALTRSLNVHQLRRHVLQSDELSSEQEAARAAGLLAQYTTALPLGSALPSTELQPADQLAVLAAQVHIGLWASTRDEAHLHRAAALLEHAAGRSAHNYALRLHLVRVYRLLGAPAPAWTHYRALDVKQVQHDTLSHFALARASTFSLAASGDLTFSQECLEASQIYISNSTETADFVVRAFAAEKYSQIADFIAFEDRLDNSLQRDLVKVEHVRMRLTHEPAASDIVDAELIELKFIFDRQHHDNRDFDVLANFQPRGTPSINEQTLMLGSSPGPGWLMAFLRVYISVLQQASDLDDTVEEKLLIGDRPKGSDTPEARRALRARLPARKPDELSELTREELALFDYAMALCDWLAPYHDYTRPPPAAVLAEASKPPGAKAGAVRAGASNSNGNGNGNGAALVNGYAKKAEEPPAVTDAPEVVARFYADMAARFKEVASEEHLLCEALHVVTLTQEALIVFNIITMRFKSAAVVKVNKLGALANIFKELKAKGTTVLKDMAAELVKMGEREGTAERRRAFVDACKPLQEASPEIEHDFLLGVAKKVTDARKRVLEGAGKGAVRVCQHIL